jgi:gamma-glutamyltranspeptidase
VLVIERGVSPDSVAMLTKMGYPSREGVLAEVQAIEISDGWLEGGHDDRGPGEAVGY